MSAKNPMPLENVQVQRAEQHYERAMKEYEAAFRESELEIAEQLRVPEFAASLGLPSPLPEYTIKILRRTMAMDKLGPSLPNRRKFYERYGVLFTESGGV